MQSHNKPTKPAWRLTILLVPLLLLTPTITAEQDPQEETPETIRIADFVRETLAQQAEAQGHDAQALLARPQTIEHHDENGQHHSPPMSLSAAIDEIFQDLHMAIPTNGIAGTNELVIGHTLHLWIYLGDDPIPGYEIHNSQFIPHTPPISAPPAVEDPGGPTRNVKGSDWTLGLHVAGLGEAVGISTHETGPYPNPDTHLAFLPDARIDFIGHATIDQTMDCSFGFCLGTGLMIANGIAQFDGDEGVEFPLLP
jgi:hypothetical protein